MTFKLQAFVWGAAILLLNSMFCYEANAQAWVGEENSLTASVNYGYARSNAIIGTDGEGGAPTTIPHQQLVMALDYVTPIEGLQLSLSLPILGTKWPGFGSEDPHFPVSGEWDDGELHITPTDLRGEVKYQFLSDPLGLSVSLGTSVPVKDYEKKGFAAAGRGLKSVFGGLSFSKMFAERFHAHGNYLFSLVEKYDIHPSVAAYGQNRSDVSFLVGYLATENIDINIGGNARWSHGGLNFSDFQTASPEAREHHDAILKEKFYLLGGGVSYFVNEDISVSAMVRFFVSGANTRNAHMGLLGLSYRIL